MVKRCLLSGQEWGTASQAQEKACTKAQRRSVKMPTESWLKVEWKLKRGAELSVYRGREGVMVNFICHLEGCFCM